MENYTKYDRHKWSRENTRMLGVSLHKDVYEEFKKIVDKNGTTRSALITKWVEDYIEQNKSAEE